MNSVFGRRILSAFHLASVATVRRSFLQVAFSTFPTKVGIASRLNIARTLRKPLTYRYQAQITRCISSTENPQGSVEGSATTTAEPTERLGNKIAKMFGWLSGVNSKTSDFLSNLVLWRSAMTMYRTCVEDVNFEDFYEACHMPDTFQSWFMVNQLHIWMCLVRLKSEGKDGQFMYRKLVEIMWQDVEARMKKMGEIDSKIVRESLMELVQEFYGLIFAYDEGLLSHDQVLAAALWRNMVYDKRNTNASELANLVEYVRRQMQHLDNLDSTELLSTGHVPWLPFRKAKEQEPFLYRSYAN